MLGKIIGVGNKIELTKVSQSLAYDMNGKGGFNDNRVLVSQVYDIIDEDRIKIAVPLDGGKVVLLPNNTRIDACFFTSKGLYQGRFIIVDRYKEGNLMVQVIELINELKKYQRRQYFRLSCTMSIMYRVLEEDELEEFYSTKELTERLEEEFLLNAVALDISGGGMRFVSKQRHNKDDIMVIEISFNYGGKVKKYGLLAKTIGVATSKNNSKLYEHRVEFSNVTSNVREEIIRFIFDEERKRRKKESGQ
ncbi:MAG: flagellar brake domain-containing protein [Lachnospiraceae bacterium]|nr:flagellar brake domain-containing protein [Lachnospiraceae bacterium]